MLNRLLAMRVFARVVETSSFTRAADSLEMPKATVTKLVQGLESHLGVKLIARTTRRMTVTDDGRAYHAEVVRLLAELDEVEATLARAQKSPRGRLRVSAGGSIATHVLIPALPAFQMRYPDIALDIGVTDRTVDLVSENVDCVIRSTAHDLSLMTRKVGSLGWTICASPSYLERQGRPRHPRDLQEKHSLIRYVSAQSGRSFAMKLQRGQEKVELVGRDRLTVDESNAHVAAALAGLGVIQTFTFMVQAHIDAGALVPLLTGWRTELQPIYVVYAPNRHLSATLRAFVDWVAELFVNVARSGDAEPVRASSVVRGLQTRRKQ